MNNTPIKVIDELIMKYGEYLEMVDDIHYEYMVREALATEILKLRDENEYYKKRLQKACVCTSIDSGD